MTKRRYLFFWFLFSFRAFGADYFFVGDAKFSPCCSAEDIININRGIEYRIDQLITKENRWTRLGKMLFLWIPLSEVEMVVQHEIFGHGYRIRDLGKEYAKVIGYDVNIPFPYSSTSGSTHYTTTDKYNTFMELAVSIAGCEANNILSNAVRKKWVQDGQINPKTAHLYLSSHHDATFYILSLNEEAINTLSGNDMEDYICWLNATYYNRQLTKNELKKRALWNLLDPFTFLALVSEANYIYSGKNKPLNMVGLGKEIKLLPSMRINLAPYGIENCFENFMKIKGHDCFFYYRQGEYDANHFWGAGIDIFNLAAVAKINLGLKIDIWRQPDILFIPGKFSLDFITFGFDEKMLHRMNWGALAMVSLDMKLSNLLNFHLQLGQKSKGYVPGESLKGGFIYRVGFLARNF